eukprot:740505-Hanusia_phi.AAC.4
MAAGCARCNNGADLKVRRRDSAGGNERRQGRLDDIWTLRGVWGPACELLLVFFIPSPRNARILSHGRACLTLSWGGDETRRGFESDVAVSAWRRTTRRRGRTRLSCFRSSGLDDVEMLAARRLRCFCCQGCQHCKCGDVQEACCGVFVAQLMPRAGGKRNCRMLSENLILTTWNSMEQHHGSASGRACDMEQDNLTVRVQHGDEGQRVFTSR